MNYKVSIIVPMFNSKEYIVNCLNSLFSQSYKSVEIIIVDDCSTDDSVSVILDNFGNRDNLIVLKNDTNVGPGASRNYGISKANGDLLAFCDSDDSYKVNYVEDMVSKFNSEVDMVICNFAYVSKSGKIMKTSSFRGNINSKGDLMISSGFSLCRTMTRKSLWNNLSIPAIYNSEDVAIIPVLVHKSREVVLLDKVLYNYLLRKESSSSKKPKVRVFFDIQKSYDFICENLYNSCFQEVEFLGIEIILYSLILIGHKANIKKNLMIHSINDYQAKFPNWNKNKHYKLLPSYKRLFVQFSSRKCFMTTRVLSFLHNHIRKGVAR